MVEKRAADGGLNRILAGNPSLGHSHNFDISVQVNLAQSVRQSNFVEVSENFTLPLLTLLGHREVVNAQHHIFGRPYHRFTIGRQQQVFGREHQLASFCHCLSRERNVNCHLVTVKVGVKRGADQGVNLNRIAFHQHRFKSLNSQPVQCGRPVEQDRPCLDDLFQHFPHLGPLLLDDAFGSLDVVSVVILHQLLNDKGAKQLQSHPLRQARLMQLQLRTDDNNRAARVIHPFA